jgi:hypothetical protein
MIVNYDHKTFIVQATEVPLNKSGLINRVTSNKSSLLLKIDLQNMQTLQIN